MRMLATLAATAALATAGAAAKAETLTIAYNVSLPSWDGTVGP